MGRIAIVGYKPKPGKEDALKALVKTHLPRLKQEGLVTDKEPFIMETEDGVVIEVFEWLSVEAMKNAHKNSTVLQMWREYAAVCTYVPLSHLPQAASLFAEFTPLH